MSRTVRDVHNRQSALRRYRAERLLRKGFTELRSKVLAIVRSRLRAKGVSLDQADLEACYAQAWHGLYAAVLAGETVESPEAWLVLVTFRRAIDELRSASRADLGVQDDVATPAHGGVGGVGARHPRTGAYGGGVVDGAIYEPDMAAALDDRARLRAVFEAMRARLSPRECEAASLCYLQGLSRAEAAARMGIGERRMRKLMEGHGKGAAGVAGKVGELLTAIQADGWCEQQSSLMRAYAFGILDPDGERHALAVAHTRECPPCRARVAALRGLASVLPPLPFALPFAGHGAAGHGAAGPRAAARWRGSLASGNTPLSLKLAVSGALLVGAGSAYLAVRSPAPPALGGAVRAAATAGRAPAVLALHRHPHSQSRGRVRAGASHSVRSPNATQLSARRRISARHPAAPGVPSSREFSPERVRGETGPTAVPVAAPKPPSGPPASSGAASEFGIE